MQTYEGAVFVNYVAFHRPQSRHECAIRIDRVRSSTWRNHYALQQWYRFSVGETCAGFRKDLHNEKACGGGISQISLFRGFGSTEFLREVRTALRTAEVDWGDDFHIEGASRDVVDLNLIPDNAVFPPRIKKREQTKRVRAVAKAATKAAAAIGSRRRG